MTHTFNLNYDEIDDFVTIEARCDSKTNSQNNNNLILTTNSFNLSKSKDSSSYISEFYSGSKKKENKGN